MTCKELHQRIEREFREPDTGILNVLPEEWVKALLDTPDAPAPEKLLRMCRENAEKDDFEEGGEAPIAETPAPAAGRETDNPMPEKSLADMLRWAFAEARKRNQR